MKKKAFFLLIILCTLSSAVPAGTLKFSDNPELHKRALELSGLAGEKAPHGAYISEATLSRYSESVETLASNCALAGIKEVIMPFNTQSYLTYQGAYSQMLERQIKSFHERGISASAFLSDDISLLYRKNRIDNIALAFNRFQKTAEASSKFDAVSLDLEPDLLNAEKKGVQKSFPWRWDKKNGWGEGKDNDTLMRETLNCLGNARGLFSVPLSSACKPFYFDECKKNRISCGSISDFMISCEYLILNVNSSNPPMILKLALPPLDNCTADGAMAICARTDGRAGGGISFAGMDWKLFCSSLKNVIGEASKRKSFRGMFFHDYDGLERIMQDGLKNEKKE